MENLELVKIDRSIFEKDMTHEYLYLWIYLITHVNHRDKKAIIGNKVILVKRGQLLTSRKRLSMDTKIQESKVERLLTLLESEHEIQQQKTSRYRIITISNYEKYEADKE